MTDGTATPDYVLELTTEIAPAKQFTVDGEPFEMKDFSHLSPSDEAAVMADLARFENLQMKLATTGDDKEAVRLATKLRDRRIKLLTELTSLSTEQAAGIPLPEQIKLIKAVQDQAGAGDDGDGD